MALRLRHKRCSRVAQVRRLGPELFAAAPGGAASSRGAGTQGEVCSTGLVGNPGGPRTEPWLWSSLPTSGDAPPSGGRRRYDRVPPSVMILGKPHQLNLLYCPPIFNSSLSAPGESELWPFL